MDYKIEFLNNSDTIYMRNIGPYGSADNFKMMTVFKDWIAQSNCQEELSMYGILGVALDNPEQMPSEECRYDLILFVPNHDNFDSKLKKGKFKEGKYAVFTIPHTTESVQHFWMNVEHIVNENGLRLSEKPIIERFKEDKGNCEFLVPIK